MGRVLIVTLLLSVTGCATKPLVCKGPPTVTTVLHCCLDELISLTQPCICTSTNTEEIECKLLDQ